MSNFIALDTSGKSLKIAAKVGEKELFLDIDNNFHHIEELMPVIDQSFKKLNIDKKTIKNIAVSQGPGSFTGIRIGIAAALGISYALKINCFGFSIFDLYKYILQKSYKDSIIVPLIDAKKNRYYCAFIEKNKKYKYLDISIQEIIDIIKKRYKNKNIIFAGEDVKSVKEIIAEQLNNFVEYSNPYKAEDILNYITEQIKKGKNKNYPYPIYIRKSDAEIVFLSKKHKN